MKLVVALMLGICLGGFAIAADGSGGDLKAGDTAIKYGEDIGKVIADIPKGGHVHTHNVKTKRW